MKTTIGKILIAVCLVSAIISEETSPLSGGFRLPTDIGSDFTNLINIAKKADLGISFDTAYLGLYRYIPFIFYTGELKNVTLSGLSFNKGSRVGTALFTTLAPATKQIVNFKLKYLIMHFMGSNDIDFAKCSATVNSFDILQRLEAVNDISVIKHKVEVKLSGLKCKLYSEHSDYQNKMDEALKAKELDKVLAEEISKAFAVVLDKEAVEQRQMLVRQFKLPSSN